MARWKINQMRLPPDSQIFFRPPSFWSLYKWYISGVLVLVFVESILVALLLVQRKHRRLAQLALQTDREFETLVTDLAKALVAVPIARVGEGIQDQMRRIIKALDADQIIVAKPAAHLGKWDVLLMWAPYEMRDLAEKYRFADFPWFAKSTLADELTLVHRINELPEEAAEERSHLVMRGVQSFARVPLKDSTVLGKMVVLCSRERTWPPDVVRRLEMIAAVFANFLERKATEDALQESETAKSHILDSLASNIAVLAPDGRVAATNSAWMEFGRQHGAEPDKIGIGVSYLDVCKKGLADGVVEAGNALFGIEAVLRGTTNDFDMDYRMTFDGESRWIHMKVRPLKTSDRGVVIIHLDITALKEAELAISESEARFRIVADTAPVMVWMSGVTKLCTYFNKPWLAFTGRSLKEELGTGWIEGVHPEDLRICLDTYSAAFDARRSFRMEYRLRRNDGQYRWIVDTGVPRYDEKNQFLGYIGSAIDITERRKMEQKLMDLSGRLISAQEEERARIARELHDDVSQRMALIMIRLDRLQQTHPTNWEEVVRELQEVGKAAEEASNDIRDLSHQLHPAILDKLGLDTATRRLCGDYSKLHRLHVEYTSKGLPRYIPFEVGLCLYRIAQEALTNAVTHSGAQEVRVDLVCHPDEVVLCVSDSGRGFDPESAVRAGGLGILSMQERIRLVGGKFTIKSSPRTGTRVVATAPLSSAILDALKQPPMQSELAS
jgi:PAS domain S-box-containing protein